MRSLLELPSLLEDDAIVNLADWVELSAWFSADRSSSREDLKKAVYRDGDVSDERAERASNDVFAELEDRFTSCGLSRSGICNYPFTLDNSGILLTSTAAIINSRTLSYMFLLAISRADMSSRSRQAGGVDPTKTFETFSSEVLRNFWGGSADYAGSLVFGTARQRSKNKNKFQSNIDHLCEHIKEGSGWKQGAPSPGAGDGGLDIVVWRRFADLRVGGLIGFGQCKTGVNWENELGKLKPRAFSATYMQAPLAIDPMQVYTVPHRINHKKWQQHTLAGGLLLDRCRLVQYSYSLSKATTDECRKWLKAVFNWQIKEMKRSRRPVALQQGDLL